MAERRSGPVGWAAASSAVRRSFERNRPAWAVQTALSRTGFPVPPDPCPPVVGLKPPTERAALADLPGTLAWVADWRARAEPCVEWERRSWASAGDQDVPARLAVADPAAAARIAGQRRAFDALVGRMAALLERWHPSWAVGLSEATGGQDAPLPDQAGFGRPGPLGSPLILALKRHANLIASLPGADFGRLQDVAEWLAAHPDSGLYARQLPVRGVDSKWLEGHRALTQDLVGGILGEPGRALGIMWRPPALIRGRFLDPALAPGGLIELAAPAKVWDGIGGERPAPAGTPCRPLSREGRDGIGGWPCVVLVLENLQSLLALPQLPGSGALALHGGGHAVDLLAEIGWLRDAPVAYWGDLDTHGFAILDRLRAFLPEARSLLMDQATLEANLDLAVPEPKPTTARLTRLTPDEQAVYQALQSSGQRLEQERVPWETALVAVRSALESTRQALPQILPQEGEREVDGAAPRRPNDPAFQQAGAVDGQIVERPVHALRQVGKHGRA
ncbi:MAG: DUF2220 family protein [Bifidobacteriaceae bacterium]|nr:DUF2220 family protein [Bifidobacteriaceae bacterium]